jgi:hypothetical protein
MGADNPLTGADSSLVRGCGMRAGKLARMTADNPLTGADTPLTGAFGMRALDRMAADASLTGAENGPIRR